jgi:repressor LexA
MKNVELTHKQRRVFEFIRERVRENTPPTIREIAKKMGFSSTGTVRDYLVALEKKGYLRRKGGLSRSMELIRERFNRIPVLASIPAGRPDLAYEDIQDYIELDNFLPRGIQQEDVFALKVKGNSMTDLGIMDGDVAIIKRQSTAYNGDIIAALLENNEVTLKILRHRANKTFLEAANKNYLPIKQEFSIMGRLVTIVRKYWI